MQTNDKMRHPDGFADAQSNMAFDNVAWGVLLVSVFELDVEICNVPWLVAERGCDAREDVASRLRPIGSRRHALGVDITSDKSSRACGCCRSAHTPCIFVLSVSCVVYCVEKRSSVVVGCCRRSCLVSLSAKRAFLCSSRASTIKI